MASRGALARAAACGGFGQGRWVRRAVRRVDNRSTFANSVSGCPCVKPHVFTDYLLLALQLRLFCTLPHDACGCCWWLWQPRPSGPTCRWCNQLNPEVKKDPFSQWEDAVIIKAHREHGNKWAREWRGGYGRGWGGSKRAGAAALLPAQRRRQPLRFCRLYGITIKLTPFLVPWLQSFPSCCQAAPTMQ